MKNKINKHTGDTGLYNGIRKILIYSFLLIVLTANVFVTAVNSLEKTNTSLNIESITSISNIIDSHFFSLAKIAKIYALRASLLGSWSPDGSRLLIVSAIRPLGETGLAAVYVLNADGTEMKEIASTLNNTRGKSLDMSLGSWSPDGNKIVIPTNIFRLRDFYVLAEPDGTLFRVVGKNYTSIDSIRENILNIEWQEDFSWNPGGTKALVVMDFNPSKRQLYTIDENGFILKQLINESIEIDVFNPIWNPDGNKIAFNDKNLNLWIINEDGTGLKQVALEGLLISWSSDDSKIFYGAGGSVRTIKVDGTGATEIISGDNRIIDDIFSLSPDKRNMIFTTSTIYNDGKITSRLYVADSDGRDQKLLSEFTGRDVISASWGPKGDKIAFIEDGNLYTITPDGSGRATIALTSFNYAWHPSGDYITFSSSIDKKTRKDVDHSTFWLKEESFTTPIFLARPDGTERVQITQNDQNNYKLGSWSPDGSRLLVESFDNTFKKMDLLVIKFNGYDEVMSLRVPSLVQQGEEFTIQVKSLSKPVENATVSLNDREIGITNETGQLNYSFNKTGRYLLNASREGYRVANKLITVKENAQLSEQESITATAVPTAVDTPKVPGFNVIFPIIALTFIILLRRIR